LWVRPFESGDSSTSRPSSFIPTGRRRSIRSIGSEHFLKAQGATASCRLRKRRCFSPAIAIHSSGLGGNTAAVAVCADIGRPSHPQLAADRGANIYLASMFVIPSEFEGDATKLNGYAVEHSMMVALANYGAATGGLAAAGRSAVWSEAGGLLVQLAASGAGVGVVAESRKGGWRAKTFMLSDLAP
jgi:predicted amidohydrolase